MENGEKEKQGDTPEEKSLTQPGQAEPGKVPCEDKNTPIGMSDIERMPVEVQRVMQAFMSSTRYVGPAINPLLEKFTPEHIDKYLDYVQRDDDNEFLLRKTNRWFYLVYVAIALFVFCVAVVYLLPRDKALLEDLIKLIVILGGGIGAGYGLSKRGT
jgi:hypothetical protein